MRSQFVTYSGSLLVGDISDLVRTLLVFSKNCVDLDMMILIFLAKSIEHIAQWMKYF